MSTDYAENLREIRRKIAGQGANREVNLIAVSKMQNLEKILACYELGIRDFGENYVQELLTKDQELKARGVQDIRWHFVGHLQRNKVKALLPLVHSIHSVDMERLALEISKRWQELGLKVKIPVFIEVNLDSEVSKNGAHPTEVRSLAEIIHTLPGLSLQGLMAIPDPKSTRDGAAFRKLRELELASRPFTQGRLSMGMSDDFEIAIREGATHIRVGTALFGERN